MKLATDKDILKEIFNIEDESSNVFKIYCNAEEALLVTELPKPDLSEATIETLSPTDITVPVSNVLASGWYIEEISGAIYNSDEEILLPYADIYMVVAVDEGPSPLR